MSLALGFMFVHKLAQYLASNCPLEVPNITSFRKVNDPSEYSR